MAVVVALLMIGGEFDLSAGAMTGTTGLITGIMMSHWHVNVWVSVFTSLVVALCIGFLNGLLVMKTGLPSFIVTLGTFFVLRGVNLAVVKQIINQVSVVDFQSAQGLRRGQQAVRLLHQDRPGLAAVGARPGHRLPDASTPPPGGRSRVIIRRHLDPPAHPRRQLDLRRRRRADQRAAGRRTGFRTKVGLFMTTAFGAWMVGMLNLFKTTTAQSTTGVGQEFIYIICAVVGGCLLTGGYGSAVGAALGALIYGMVGQGIVYAGWDSDWLYSILGVMLLGAVLVNNFVKSRAERVR